MSRLPLGTCSVHDLPLVPDVVPVRHGLRRPLPGECEAQRRLFPNARSSVGAGCIVFDDSPTEMAVLYCLSCREAEAEWFAAHS